MGNPWYKSLKWKPEIIHLDVLVITRNYVSFILTEILTDFLTTEAHCSMEVKKVVHKHEYLLYRRLKEYIFILEKNITYPQ